MSGKNKNPKEPRQSRLNTPKKQAKLNATLGAIILIMGGLAEGAFAVIKILSLTYICPATFYPLTLDQFDLIEEVCFLIPKGGLALFEAYARYVGIDLAITIASITGARLMMIRKWKTKSETQKN